jgi:hypothetical protein
MLEHCYERTSIELYLPGSMGSSLEAQRNSNIFLKIPPGRRSRVLAQHGKDKYTQVNLIPVETYPVAFAGSGKETQIPKYIIATPHREPYIVLEFCTGSQNQTGEPPRPGMVINSTEEDLMHGRPTKRNLVELREVSTRYNETAWTVNTLGTPRYTLRVPKQKELKSTKSDYSCDCMESTEIPRVELVSDTTPDAGKVWSERIYVHSKMIIKHTDCKQYKKFFVNGID